MTDSSYDWRAKSPIPEPVEEKSEHPQPPGAMPGAMQHAMQHAMPGACQPHFQQRPLRKSSGIACCRYNNKLKNLEILLIKKRYTYSFAAFVLGQYSKNDNKRLKMLFDGMTVQEKIDIISMRFDILWYKIWLEFPTTQDNAQAWDPRKRSNLYNHIPFDFHNSSRIESYLKKKRKFEMSFLLDEGERLRRLISNTKNNELMWEIPKGRKNKKETSLDCAIREFGEEANIGIDEYNLIFDIKPIVESYVSANTEYVHNYFIAYTSKTIDPVVDFSSKHQLVEIDSIRWVSLGEVKFIDENGRLYKLIRQIFDVFKSKYKQRYRPQ
jgi:8-oxo-dGTP pyrophosphatase MutT (NUDIX family)